MLIVRRWYCFNLSYKGNVRFLQHRYLEMNAAPVAVGSPAALNRTDDREDKKWMGKKDA